MEAEALAELALQVAAVAGSEESGGKQHNRRRLRRCLGGKEHARQAVVVHRRRVRRDGLAHPVVELAGGHALIPALQRLNHGRLQLLQGAAGLGGDIHTRHPWQVAQVLIDLAVQVVAAVLVHQVPLVEGDDEGLAGLQDHVEDALVLLGDFLGGVDKHDAHLRRVDDAAGAQGGVVLVALDVLDLLAQARGVDELPQALIQLHQGVHRIHGGTCSVVDDRALLRGQLIQQRGLAHVRLAHQRHAARAGRNRGVSRLLREQAQDLIQDVGAAAAVLRGYRPGIAQAQRVELRHVGVHGLRIELVGHQNHRHLGALQLAGHNGIRLGDADLGVDDEDDDVRGGHSLLRLARDRRVDALDVRVPAAGVLDKEALAVPIRHVGHAVTGHARVVLHHCFATPQEAVDQ